MKHLKVLLWVRFATSKMVDTYYKKHFIQIALQVAEKLKT